MKISLPILLALTLCACMSAGKKDPPAKQDDLKNIQGTWQFVSMVVGGHEEQMPAENRLVITADLMKIVYPKDDPMGWKYTIDPSKDPREMDQYPEEDPGHPIHQKAIYSLDGDTLKINSAAAGKPRPTSFESKKGDFGGVWILKRVVTKPSP